jgi:hypothetical protein
MQDGRWIEVLAAVAAIVGGVILLQFTSTDVNGGSNGYSFTGRNIFETVSHGVGLYLIARGVMMGRASHLAETQRDEAHRTTEAVRELIEVTRQTGGGYRGTEAD